MRDETRAAIERALAVSELPREIQERIIAVVSALPLGVEQTYDVALELIAHFEDGLSSGRPPAELLASFGEEQTVVSLIRKTKRRRWPFRQDTEHIMSGDSFLSTLWQNFHYAGRRLAQSPGFTATAVLSLALGIGANTTIFSLVNAVILKDPPFEKPEELVNVLRTAPDFPYGTFSYPDFKDLRDGTEDVFSAVSASQILFVQTDRDGGVELINAEAVSGSHFPMLGLEAEMGRTLLPEDDLAEGAHPVVMLGHGYWQRAFGANPDVVGEEVRLGGRLYTIIGVAPEDYPGSFRGLPVAVFLSLMMVNDLQPGGADDLKSRSIQSLFVKGRIAPGVTMVRAQAVVSGVADHLRGLDLEDFDPDTGFLLVPTGDVILMPGMDPYIRAAAWLLMVVVGLVLLIACTNLASFLLAKGVERRKEIALRVALGASRRNLMGQLLSETLLLGLLGGVAGVVVAVWLLRILVTADLPLPIPITLDLSLDTTVLGFSVGISLLAGIILGLAPAVQSTRPDVAATLRDESAGGGARGRLTLRNSLVVAQVAGSLVLLITAGLFSRSAQQMQSVDPGFAREPTAILSLFVPSDRYSEEKSRVFTGTLLERFRELPGVEAVGLIGNLHLNAISRWVMSINVDGVEPPPGREFHTVDYTAVDPGFFDAAGIRILRGRNFTEYDLPDSPPVVLVNQNFAEKFWPGRDPVGQRIQRDDASDYTVVGVTQSTKIRTLGEPPRPFIYRSYNQDTPASFYVLARTSIDPEQTALDMMAAGRELDPELWVWEAKTMERHLGITLMPARMSALILSAFAALALGLAIIGLYGMVSYAVSCRAREVGIRMSLGADSARVVRMLMGSGLKLVVIGNVVGLAIALAAAKLVSGLLFNVSSLDLMTFLFVPVVLGAAAMLAAYIPARRASRVDPAAALRRE
jgi:predicted permease